ncbi:calcium-binding protein [Donghicola mangrovi]|uniref:Calcium-binding protein n=1 Tax=Donghicola mangrovi TaxID=2729614 RepID=A0A850Q6X9_9RHOB|nr:calcium-binding protein [Donghicola mangrovi]NVO24684.1 calcium-binding protein [Donghicola mangrovi]
MAIKTLEIQLDGYSDFDTLWGPDSWDEDGWRGYLSIYDQTKGNHLQTTALLSGDDWTIAALRFGAATNNTAIITDEDNGSGRLINYLKLGQNSEISLTTTQIRFIEGYSGDLHDITLGRANTQALTLTAAENIVTTGSGYVGSIDLGGDDTVTVGSGGAGIIKVRGGTNVVNVGSGYVSSVVSNDYSINTITVDTGGIDQVTLSEGLHSITVGEGGIGGINVYDGGETDLHVGAGGVQQAFLSTGDDTVDVDGGYVASLNLRAGEDSLVVRNRSHVASVIDEGTGDFTVQRASTIRYLEVDGDATIDVRDTSRNYIIKANRGEQVVETARGNLEAFYGHDTSTTMSIGTGGVTEIALSGSEEDTHSIASEGYLGQLSVYDGAQCDVTIGAAGAGTMRLSTGDDTVTTGEGYVQFIATGDGNDLVIMGSGGATAVSLGGDDDRILIGESQPDYALTVRGGYGSDTVDFSGFEDRITFSLAHKGLLQNFAAPRGAQDIDAKGWLQTLGVENLTGGIHNDKLTGNTWDNVLNGNTGNDTLKGGSGADTLQGGSGRDRMYAGSDNDVDKFVFVNAGDSDTGRNRDVIYQFDRGEDLIDLSGIDANLRLTGDQSFEFSDRADANSVWVTASGRNVVVSGDTDGDGAADFQILVTRLSTMSEDDFIL